LNGGETECIYLVGKKTLASSRATSYAEEWNKKIALRPFVNNEKFEFEIVKNPNFDPSVVLQEGK